MMISLNLKKSKKGAAAFYVVIFTTLLLSVITMSFIRIMISEATKSTNDDLSKSAYDSALAGVEDAKIALVKYHQCLDKGETAKENGNSCQRIIWAMQTGGCDTVSKALQRNSGGAGGEVIVRESLNGANASTDMEQAYTCVKLSENLEDYRANVSGTNRVRVVPVRTSDTADGSAVNLDKIHGIRFSWGSMNKTRSFNDGKFVNTLEVGDYIQPITVDFYQTDADYFTLGELSVNNDNNTGTDHFSLLLQPNSSGEYFVGPGGKYLPSNKVLDFSDKSNNGPVKVQCKNNADLKCSLDIEFPQPFRNSSRNLATTLIRVELPYGTPGDDTDFSIQLCTGSGNNLCNETVNFVGVQARIDSTGRANDLFRRVEARVELIDTNFPYPEFAVQLNGNYNDETKKNFWVTRNCWRADGGGTTSGCNDTGEV